MNSMVGAKRDGVYLGFLFFKQCSNCEGEGAVCIWGSDGHELPASRRVQYPNDQPPGGICASGPAYPCPVCNGEGMYSYDQSGAMVFPSGFGAAKSA